MTGDVAQKAMERQLREFDRQAAKRVRIAEQSGFNVSAIEAANATERKKLTQTIVADRVGSLQQLLDDIDSGALS